MTASKIQILTVKETPRKKRAGAIIKEIIANDPRRANVPIVTHLGVMIQALQR